MNSLATVSGQPYIGSYFRGQNLNPNNPIRADTSGSSELNSLSYGDAALCSVVLSNTQGDGRGLGYTSVLGRLSLTSGNNIASGGAALIQGWLLRAMDGVNYETYRSGTAFIAPVNRTADFIWSLEWQVSGGPPVVKDVWASQGAPVCGTQKLLLYNLCCSGVSLTSGPGNSVNLYYSIP